MKNVTRFGVATMAAVSGVIAWAVSTAYAAAPTAETLASDAGESFRDTGIAVIAVLIPLAVAFLLAKKALPWARNFLHI